MEPNIQQPQGIEAEAAARDAEPTGEPRERGPGGLRPLPDDAVILLPVRNVVLFPGLVAPLQVGRMCGRDNEAAGEQGAAGAGERAPR